MGGTDFTITNAVMKFDDLRGEGAAGHALKIKVGGITCALSRLNERQYGELKQRYANFLCDDILSEESDIGIELFETDEWEADAFPEIEVRYIGGRHYAFRWDFYSEFDASKGRGRFLSVPDTNILSIDAFVRISYSLVSVMHGGFLIHSAAILRGGNGYLFSGVSDSGKTTIARASMEAGTVLTDEISLVKPTGGYYSVYGTPFWGELRHGLPEHGPLRGVMFLVKDTKVQLCGLRKSDVMKKLMMNVLFFAKDEKLSGMLFRNCCDAVADFDGFDLHFLPDNSFWRCIDGKYS